MYNIYKYLITVNQQKMVKLPKNSLLKSLYTSGAALTTFKIKFYFQFSRRTPHWLRKKISTNQIANLRIKTTFLEVGKCKICLPNKKILDLSNYK